MRTIPAFCASLVLALLISMSATIALAQITPSDDSYTLTSSPTVNFGAKNTLEVESAGATTFVRFDLSGIPSTVTGSMVAKRASRKVDCLGPPSRNDEAHERNARETELAACVDGSGIGSRCADNALVREGENRVLARFSFPASSDRAYAQSKF